MKMRSFNAFVFLRKSFKKRFRREIPRGFAHFRAGFDSKTRAGDPKTRTALPENPKARKPADPKTRTPNLKTRTTYPKTRASSLGARGGL